MWMFLLVLITKEFSSKVHVEADEAMGSYFRWLKLRLPNARSWNIFRELCRQTRAEPLAGGEGDCGWDGVGGGGEAVEFANRRL